MSTKATLEQRKSARLAEICPLEIGEGFIKFVADGDKPEVSLPVQILIVGD